MIYIKDSIYYRRRLDLEPKGIECIWIELILKHKHVLFGLFYRPPNSNSIYYSTLEDSIHLAVDTGINDIIITGDFNFNVYNLQSARKINDICSEFSLTQIVNEPTHFTEYSSSLIDLMLVSNPNHVILNGVGDPFLGQDLRYHCPIFGVFKFSTPKRKTFTRHIWRYEQGNYELLKENAASADWNALKNSDIEIYAEGLINKILEIAKACIPNKIVTIRPSDPPWITSTVKRYIRKRKRAYRRAKQTNSASDWNNFRRLRNKTVSIIREAKKSLNQSLSEKLKSDNLSSKQWWSLLKSFISPTTGSTSPPLEKDGLVFDDDQEKSNLLNDFFRDQTLLNDHDAVLPEMPPYSVENNLSSLVFTPDEVKLILKSLPVGKATGPDGLSNRILSALANELSGPVCSLFNESLLQGIVPSCFKETHVCPIFKGSDPAVPSNYRPISLLSNLDKALERLVFKHLYNHFWDNNILTSFQSGFIRGDSTVNQLTYLYNTFCQALDSGKEVRAVFCDISKAFDRVWHGGLIQKLKAAGITGTLIHWFTSYLENRKQRVVLSGTKSNWNFIKAGVPQGSILGPLLFLLYINDIVTEIGSNIRLFADDTSLYIVVDNPNTAAEVLNTDLDKISNWARSWLVKFNPSKNESLVITRKHNKPQHPPVFMSDQQINEVQFHKHLGLYISSDCTWHKHVEYVKSKAWGRINVMRQFKYTLDRKSLETIYLSFIRPILEYADVVWDNCTQQEKNDLEKIQLEAARIATGSTKLVSIQNLYKEIGWESLDSRRRKHKLVLFYKMYYNIAPSYLSSLVPQPNQNTSRYSLRNSNDIRTILTRTSQYYNSFLPTAIRDWNELPCTDKIVDTVDAFKRQINQDKVIVPKYFYTGNRSLQVLHTRLRTGCSSLNFDLYSKNIVESPLCSCGEVENADNIFFRCHLYLNHRQELIDNTSHHGNVTLNTLLNGDCNLPYESNISIFEAVHRYIKKTKRF
ncbi:MAG: reverse transcriptase domain-containing protein [Candidatus Thiodiazotropha endolucinida]|nr:hypothetical protein [Candidatus Thiodiazotropha taylori]MCW4346878.1 reverse transcriptase domain-containing protein [Candidatus Thiodiazotropha endolucinida]